MQTLDAIDTIDKHIACRNAECNLKCEECPHNVTFDEVNEAWAEARKALMEKEIERRTKGDQG